MASRRGATSKPIDSKASTAKAPRVASSSIPIKGGRQQPKTSPGSMKLHHMSHHHPSTVASVRGSSLLLKNVQPHLMQQHHSAALAASAAGMPMRSTAGAGQPGGANATRGNPMTYQMKNSAMQAANAAAAAAAAASMSNANIPMMCANAPNFTGTWQLDSSVSDSLNSYLEAMGLPLIARQAAEKLDLTVIINQNGNDFTITRKTRIFEETRHLKFGQDLAIKENPIRCVATEEHIKTTTKLTGFRGVLTDTRSLVPKEDDKGGVNTSRMCVVLELNLPEKPPVIVTRYFNKVSDSISLKLDDSMINYENPVVDSKRKR